MAIQTIRDGATNLCLDGCPRAAVSLFSYKPFDGAIDCRAMISVTSPAAAAKPAPTSKAANANASAAPKSSNCRLVTRLTYCCVEKLTRAR